LARMSQEVMQEMLLYYQKNKVLIYNGQNDVVVNNAGVLQYLNSLNWNGIGPMEKDQKTNMD
jgi:hypothetical protein